MPKVNNFADLGKMSPDKFHIEASPIIKELADVVNGKLGFDDNIDCQHVDVTFLVSNQDVAITHNLNRTGLRYLKAKASVDCSIYDGISASTKNTIYLRSTQPATVTLVLY